MLLAIGDTTEWFSRGKYDTQRGYAKYQRQIAALLDRRSPNLLRSDLIFMSMKRNL